MKIKITAAALAACLFMAGCSGAASVNTSKNSEPVDITIWHYYNGSQKAAFDDLVNEFNDTVGKEKGIYVEGHSSQPRHNLLNALHGKVYLLHRNFFVQGQTERAMGNLMGQADGQKHVGGIQGA